MKMPKLEKEKLLPELQEIFADALKGKNEISVGIAFELDENERLVITKREDIFIGYDENKVFFWHVNSIRDLFRGNKTPPDLQHYPEEYVMFFATIEQQIADFSDAIGVFLTDVDFERIFSAMRRRPDGKRINLLHDLVWQVTALALAMYPTSEAEYTAIFTQLEKSARTFNMGCGSKNYLEYLLYSFE
jgi:hypothetical protein